MHSLTMRGISKSFPGTQALNKVSLELRRGEVLALMGENGAGKSTLMKILGGAEQPDEGEIILDGERIAIPNIRAAQSLGIIRIHQELLIAGNLDIAGNIFLGRESKKTFARLIARAEMRAAAARLLAEVGLHADPSTPARKLSIAQLQLVEIARALSQDAQILIMDEPTSSLSAQDAERLLAIIGELRRRGMCIVYISHRIEEVMQIADRVTVLRDGQNAGDLIAQQASPGKIVSLMVGRELTTLFPRRRETPGDPILHVNELQLPGSAKTISFFARKGEILGFAGLIGSGRTEAMRILAGVDRALSGEMLLNGKRYDPKQPFDAIRHGVFMVPEDRKSQGLILSMNVAENISLPDLPNYRPKWLMSRDRERRAATTQVHNLRIRPPDIYRMVLQLSGGNQQKVVLGKWLNMSPRVLIVDEPTRGIDIGARVEIYERIVALADAGVTILMVSSDMEEILGLSDRVVVVHEGEVSGVLAGDQITREHLGTLMTGGTVQAA